MEKFGYETHIIFRALNDMLVRQRPLVWCDDGHDAVRFKETARIAITPIGDAYFKKLFGQLYYDETCLATSLRSKSLLDDTLAFHKEMWEQDASEIRTFVKAHGGLVTYLQLYPLEEPSISYVHARNLKVGFEKRKSPLPLGFDEKREEFIRAEVMKLLGIEDENG
jgi:hypothetical protein